MGSTASIEEKQEKSILRKPQQGEASDFYWACREGNLELVRQIFSSTSFIDINKLEPNGSTGLHAAAYFGHFPIVQFLLQNGVFRHRKNRYGLTAYEEAKDDQIRELFRRPPDSQRFSTNKTDNSQKLFNFGDDESVEDDAKPNNKWVAADGEGPFQENQTCIAIVKPLLGSSILRSGVVALGRFMDYIDDDHDDDDDKFIEMISEEKISRRLQTLVDECVTLSHPEYNKACELLIKYDKSKNIEHLLHLYTLETPFYKNINNKDGNNGCFYSATFIGLKSLKNRAYQGRSYRGLVMSKTDIRAYTWAWKNTKRVLCIQTLCSSSTEKDIALGFIKNVPEGNVSVLMIFNFPDKCDTAIQLFRLSEDLPAISDYENEREVLILLSTCFRVTNIDVQENSPQYTIHFENVPAKIGILSAFRLAWEELKYDKFKNAESSEKN